MTVGNNKNTGIKKYYKKLFVQQHALNPVSAWIILCATGVIKGHYSNRIINKNVCILDWSAIIIFKLLWTLLFYSNVITAANTYPLISSIDVMMVLYFIISAAAAIVALIFTFRKYIEDYITLVKQVKTLQSPSSSWWGNIGPLVDTNENIFKIVRRWALEYYPIYHLWAFFMVAVQIINPDDLETILTNTKHNKKALNYNMLEIWLGTGLLTSDGDKWQKRRKILTPSFHFNILQNFIKIFNNETEKLIEIFKKECHNDYIPLNHFISDFTLSTIAETSMGIKFDKNSISCTNYKKALYELCQIFVYRATRAVLMYKIFYIFHPFFFREKLLVRTLHKFTNDVIEKRKKNFKPITPNTDDFLSYSTRKRQAMLDLLLTAQREEGSIDDEGIREEVDTFMFEGHDTVSVAICNTLLLLASHRDIQDKIYEEIQQILPNSIQPDVQRLKELKYTKRCIQEALRIYPSVPMISRILGEDMTTSTGHILKAGTHCYLHIYDIHHNPNIYPEPEKYDPDRFLPENCQNRHTFAYVPFSAGPRNCIGQQFAILEIKAVLCRLLQNFILEPVDTPATIVPIADLVFRTKDSIKLKFVPRK